MADVIRVSRVAAADRAGWQRLWEEWQAHMKGRVPPEATDRAWAMLLDPSSGLHGLIARNDRGEALGFANLGLTPFAWTGGHVLFLQDLYVTPQSRGQGAGEALLKASYGLADRIGASQVFWMVDEADGRLQQFYATHAIRTPYIRYMRGPWPW